MYRILVIEDNYELRNNISEILELSNYKLITAENGKEGVEKAIREQPDLILCDIMMPVLDGYGVLHSVHRNEKIKNTPFIFMTAKTERNDFRKAMDLGADDYLTKPFTGDELLNAVECRLRKLESVRQVNAQGMEGIRQLMEAAGSNASLQSLSAERPVNRYKTKEIIYTEGNHPTMLFYVVKGKVKTYRSNDDGKEFITNLFVAGDFFGYVALLEGTAYRDTAKALEETELAIIPRKDFEDLLNRNPQVAKKLIQLLVKNISEKEDLLLNLAYNSLRKKVAETLVMLVKKYINSGEKNFVIDLSRESLANIAGTAKESLTRTLSDFHNENLIEILKDGSISIINLAKLEHMLN
jgi:CRP-like cAMP-binding protein